MLKVLSYWNLNNSRQVNDNIMRCLKYYHIGI